MQVARVYLRAAGLSLNSSALSTGEKMKIKSIAIVTLIASSLALPFQALADTVLYTDGAVNGTFGGDTINNGFAVSDSFTLDQTSTITGVNFGAWTHVGDTISTIEYGITSLSGTYPVTGAAVVSNGPVIPGTGFAGGPNRFYDVRIDSFSTSNITLGPGTYYLVLQAAATEDGTEAYWDANFGWSTATMNYPNNNSSLAFPQSFDILGIADPVPEPSTWAMMILGFLGLGFMAYRKRSIVRFA
jgi:hypothetical protein